MTEPLMIPYYEKPEYTDTVTWCTRCGKWWAYGRTRFRCAANHPLDQCCHQGEREVEIVDVLQDAL